MNSLQANEEPFDFSKYRVKNEALPTELPSQQGQSEEPFDFTKYKVKEPPTDLEEVGRHVTRTGSRITESVLGFPGDLYKFTKYLADKFPNTPKLLQREPSPIQKAGKYALESLPTSEKLKEFTSYLTSGFTDPQSANEELGDEIASLATVLISPSKAVGGFGSLLKTLGSATTKATVTKGSGKAAELFGATEPTKNKIELGTLLLTGLLSQKTANMFVSDQYKKAHSQIPSGTMLNTSGLATELQKVDQQLSKGISTPTKNEVRGALRELESKASGGAMEAQELIESYHNINERMTSKKLFDELNSTERKLLKNRYDLVKNEVGKGISAYGKTNPEFYKIWKGANEGFSTLAQSKGVSNFLQSKIGKLPQHLAGSIALDLFLGTPASTLALGTSYGAVKSGELLYRIAKSPTLRDHYMKVILEASNENLPGVIKNLEFLDKAIPKED